MPLYHMHSDVLQGFYQSDVFVSAKDHEQAVIEAAKAYDRWVAQMMGDMGYHRLISESYPDDENHEKEANEKRDEFLAEVIQKLKPTAFPAAICVSS